MIFFKKIIKEKLIKQAKVHSQGRMVGITSPPLASFGANQGLHQVVQERWQYPASPHSSVWAVSSPRFSCISQTFTTCKGSLNKLRCFKDYV